MQETNGSGSVNSRWCKNTFIKKYSLWGSYIQVKEICHQDVVITITIGVILIPLGGNGSVASMFLYHLGLCIPQQSVGQLWHFLCWCHKHSEMLLTDNADRLIDGLGPVNLVLSTLLLELVNLNLNVKKGHKEFFGNLWCYTAPYM